MPPNGDGVHAEMSVRLSGDWLPDGGCLAGLVWSAECAAACQHAHTDPSGTLADERKPGFATHVTHTHTIPDSTGAQADDGLHTIGHAYTHGSPHTLSRFTRADLRRKQLRLRGAKRA